MYYCCIMVHWQCDVVCEMQPSISVAVDSGDGLWRDSACAPSAAAAVPGACRPTNAERVQHDQRSRARAPCQRACVRPAHTRLHLHRTVGTYTCARVHVVVYMYTHALLMYSSSACTSVPVPLADVQVLDAMFTYPCTRTFIHVCLYLLQTWRCWMPCSHVYTDTRTRIHGTCLSVPFCRRGGAGRHVCTCTLTHVPAPIVHVSPYPFADVEVLDAMFARAHHYARVGDKDAAFAAFATILARVKISTGRRIDAAMANVRVRRALVCWLGVWCHLGRAGGKGWVCTMAVSSPPPWLTSG
jgi:hypothetical protein